eukprot:3076889-Rhodomonas_salina.1
MLRLERELVLGSFGAGPWFTVNGVHLMLLMRDDGFFDSPRFEMVDEDTRGQLASISDFPANNCLPDFCIIDA